MREIKFRAWDGEKMHVVGKIHFDQVGGYSFCNTAQEDCRILTGAKLMQYTGLKDKNGKEIFEGDIVKVEDYMLPVTWGEISDCCVNGVGFNLDPGHNERLDWDECEIVGNIHENPELVDNV